MELAVRNKKIRVLIVDDSASIRMMLEQIFVSDPAFEVIGLACDGEEAIEAVKRLSPDVITMDIHMPQMSGLEATRRIMEWRPTPIVIVSGNLDEEEIVSSFRAMEAGALVALPKPRGIDHPQHEADIANLILKVKLMAEVTVIKRRPRQNYKVPAPLLQAAREQAFVIPQVVAIGASTGGPVVVNTILSGLPQNFPLPVLIVQHMAEGFIQGFADWLNMSSSLPVHVATRKEKILPGHVYVAPDRFHMLADDGGRIALTRSEPEHVHCPSVSTLFRSVADLYGRSAIGILLTGMGDDGARELKLMKECGCVTMAQDRESSIIFGMPGEAVKLDAATYVLPPDGILAALKRLVTAHQDPGKLESRNLTQISM